MKISKAQAEARLAFPKVSLEDATKRLDEKYTLAYLHQGDSIEDIEILEEVIKEGYSEKLSNNMWDNDGRYEEVHRILEELFPEEDIEDIEETLRERIYDRDDSDIEKDLVKNTGSIAVYYDLDYETDGYGYPAKAQAKVISKKFKIDWKEYGEALTLMVAQASYGGQLVILFAVDPIDFYGQIKEKYVRINAHLAIMDRMQGSGDYMKYKEVKLPFIRENFRTDEGAPGYSLTGDVFGMGLDQLDTQMIFTEDKEDAFPVPAEVTEISDQEKREIEYERSWTKDKKCTRSDMKISRHANTPYKNEIPCGSTCTECGTFWID